MCICNLISQLAINNRLKITLTLTIRVCNTCHISFLKLHVYTETPPLSTGSMRRNEQSYRSCMNALGLKTSGVISLLLSQLFSNYYIPTYRKRYRP